MKIIEILLALAADGQSLRGAHARFAENVTIGARTFPAGAPVPVALTKDDSGKPEVCALLGDALTAAILSKGEAENAAADCRASLAVAVKEAAECKAAAAAYRANAEKLMGQAVEILKSQASPEERAKAYDALTHPLSLTADEKARAALEATLAETQAKLAALPKA